MRYISFYSWTLFNEPSDHATISGTVIFVPSGLYIGWRKRRLSPDMLIPVRAGR